MSFREQNDTGMIIRRLFGVKKVLNLELLIPERSIYIHRVLV
jgi:hypothetical protein